MLKTIYDSLLTLAYPAACAVCGKSVENFHNGNACNLCWSKTSVFAGDESICVKCGKLQNGKFLTGAVCHECDQHFYDLARAAGVYEFALSASVLLLKRQPVIAGRLRDLIVESFLRQPFANADCIIPVPLSRKRQIIRGFNQASLISNLLSAKCGIESIECCLFRTRHSKLERAGMDRKGRRLSVEKSFDACRSQLIRNKTIILVDDVFTSGATASVCASALKKSGARKVFVYTIARAA